MKVVTKIIRKVAEQASKLVLFGALVSGVGMTSYATETTVGPTIEKAQLEAVSINLDAVVAAITKVDPNWVKYLPISHRSSKTVDSYYWYIKIGSNQYQQAGYGENPSGSDCPPDGTEICAVAFDTNHPANTVTDLLAEEGEDFRYVEESK